MQKLLLENILDGALISCAEKWDRFYASSESVKRSSVAKIMKFQKIYKNFAELQSPNLKMLEIVVEIQFVEYCKGQILGFMSLGVYNL